jgi:hypothetical protein
LRKNFPDERKEGKMLLIFFLSVIAGVVTNFISNWLGGIKKRNAK